MPLQLENGLEYLALWEHLHILEDMNSWMFLTK